MTIMKDMLVINSLCISGFCDCCYEIRDKYVQYPQDLLSQFGWTPYLGNIFWSQKNSFVFSLRWVENWVIELFETADKLAYSMRETNKLAKKDELMSEANLTLE